MFAIVLLVVGAVASGIAGGSGTQFTAALVRAAKVLSRNTVSIIAVILAAPALAVLVVALFGALTIPVDPNTARHSVLLTAGGMVAALLLVAASMAAILGIGAIRGKPSRRTVDKQQ
jgi:hypothetical protein